MRHLILTVDLWSVLTWITLICMNQFENSWKLTLCLYSVKLGHSVEPQSRFTLACYCPTINLTTLSDPISQCFVVVFVKFFPIHMLLSFWSLCPIHSIFRFLYFGQNDHNKMISCTVFAWKWQLIFVTLSPKLTKNVRWNEPDINFKRTGACE